MKKFILLTFALFLGSPFAFAQLTIQAPNGDVGVGTDTPGAKLDVDGALRIDPGNTSNNFGEIFNTSANLNIDKVRPTGTALIDINPRPSDGTSNAKFRFFRQTNTTGAVDFDVHHGNATSAINSRFSGNGDSFLNKDFGNVAIGVGAGSGEKLHVAGDLFVTGVITPSDKRLKNKVKSFNEGLNVVLNLNPVSYNYNGKASLDTKRNHIGIIAQELQEEAPYLVEDFEYQIFDDEANKIGSESYLKIHDSEIKYLLINSIKEQHEIIENQQEVINTQTSKIESLEKDMEDLKAIVNKLASSDTTIENYNVVASESSLKQNIPNPFEENTTFRFEVAEKAQKAVITITSMDGKFIKNISVNSGIGEVNFRSENLASGTYNYQLFVDGQLIESKKMVILK